MDQAINKIITTIADDASRLAVADLIAYLKETNALGDFDETAYKPELKEVIARMVAPPQIDQVIQIVTMIADDASRLAVADLIAYLKETNALGDFDETAYKPRLKAVMARMVAPQQHVVRNRKTKDVVHADDMLTQDGYLI